MCFIAYKLWWYQANLIVDLMQSGIEREGQRGEDRRCLKKRKPENTNVNDSILHGLLFLQFHSLDLVEKLAGQETNFGIYRLQQLSLY